MSAIGFPVLYMPGRHAFETQHAGEAWAFEQHGERMQLQHVDAVEGRLLQEWSTPADARSSGIAERFTAAIDAVPRDARFNAWDEARPIYVSAGNAHAHSATGGGYFGIDLGATGRAGDGARSAVADALAAVDEFRSIAGTDGPVVRPLLTPVRAAALAGGVLAVGLVVASHAGQRD